MVRKIKPVIYIFCEWKTEEKYFQKLKRILRNTSSQIKAFDLEWWTNSWNLKNRDPCSNVYEIIEFLED